MTRRQVLNPSPSLPQLLKKLWENRHSIKFTILVIELSGIKYIHTVIQASLLSIFRSFSPSQKEALYPLNSKYLYSLLPAPGHHHSTLHLYEFDASSSLKQVESHSVCLWGTGLFHLAQCLLGSSMLGHISESRCLVFHLSRF